MRYLFLITGLLTGSLMMSGCGDAGTATKTETTAESTAVTDSTQLLAYVCPMHCEGSGSTVPGKCKVCDMELIKNPDHQAATDSVAH